MEDSRKVALLMMALFVSEDDSVIDDVVTLLLNSNSVSAYAALAIKKEDREKPFLLGHLARSESDWIDHYLDFDFRRLFRMRKDTYKELVRVIAPLDEKKLNRGDAPLITVERATLMTLWYLAAQVSMYKAGDRFDMASSTLFHEIHTIVDILSQLSSKFIVWPNETDSAIIRQQFKDRARYPGVIGGIDGCHIDVLVPAGDQNSYIDRKLNHSVLLQGICTATKLFTNVSIGTPGSCNDCRALRYSSFYQKVTQEGPDSLFYNSNNRLVGDKAYPNRTWLLAPFKDYGNLTLVQRQHNYIHSSTQTVIEHSFGLLKGRWRCLLGLKLKRVGRASNFIMACCVLHNFCFLHNDSVINDMVHDERQVPQQVLADYHDAQDAQLAKAKRDRLASVLQH